MTFCSLIPGLDLSQHTRLMRTRYLSLCWLLHAEFSACTYDGTIQVVPCRGAGAIRVGDWKLMIGTFGYVSCDRTYLLPACLALVPPDLTRAHVTGRALRSVFAERQLESVNAALDGVFFFGAVSV